MGWSTPNRRSGWGPSERPDTIQNRLIRVVRNIMELVPGGVLRAGKSVFGEGSGWMLSVREDGAGLVDIGDEDNYLRFDGQDFTWHTPLTELTEDGTLSAVNVKIRVEQSYERPSRLEWIDQGQPVAKLVTENLSDTRQISTILANKALGDNLSASVAVLAEAASGGTAVVVWEVVGDGFNTSASAYLAAGPGGGSYQLIADVVTLETPRLDLAGSVLLHEIGAPDPPASHELALFARDDGAGKTQLCVRFATGAVQILATEP